MHDYCRDGWVVGQCFSSHIIKNKPWHLEFEIRHGQNFDATSMFLQSYHWRKKTTVKCLNLFLQQAKKCRHYER